MTHSTIEGQTQAAGASDNGARPDGRPRDRSGVEREIYEASFRSPLIGLARLDADTKFLAVNDRFCEIVGRRREDLLAGMDCFDITYEDDVEPTRNCIATLIAGADHFSIEKRYRRPDGSLAWVSNWVSAVRDESGDLQGAVAFVADVTDRKRTEDALREGEKKYRALVEALGVAVYTTDAEGRITQFNEAAVEMWRRRPELGRDLWCGSWRLFYTDGRPMAHDECPMAITLKENRPVRGAEAIAERPDGSRVTFIPFPTPFTDDSGELIGAVNVLVDISKRKAAEAEAERQQALIKAITDNMSVGLLMMDAGGRIEFMNPAAERITGYRFEDVRGHLAHDKVHYVHPDGRPYPVTECPIDGANEEGVMVTGHEDVFVRPDGTFYNVLCNVAPIVRDGVKAGALIDLRDATEEKRAEEAVRQSMAIKDQFLGLVSHELRTPIATIFGNAVLLLRRGDSLDSGSRQQALSDVAGEAEKLQRIIENLLLLTRVDSGQHWEVEPLRLPPLVEQSVAAFKRRNPDREILVKSDGRLPIVMGRETVLGLVLENLISNADKYSPPDRHIEVIISENGPQVEVCVRDQGIGLNADEIDEVFTPFYRSLRARNSAHGIGLGLAVCKRVIEAQGGSIRAVSRPEGGCDFVFSLRQVTEAATL